MTMRSIALLAVAAVAAAGCTTKTFEPLPPLGADGLKALSCAQLDDELPRLRAHERRIDEEAFSGTAEQWLVGGMFSVMADRELEAAARRRIRDREHAIVGEKLRKECRSRAVSE